VYPGHHERTGTTQGSGNPTLGTCGIQNAETRTTHSIVNNFKGVFGVKLQFYLLLR